MLVFKESLIDLPIVSLQTGTKIGEIASVIINPNAFSIEAFDVVAARRKRVLFAHDIKEVSPKFCVVDDESQLIEDEDLVRLDNLRAINYEIINKRVVTKNGLRVGRVRNWICESSSFEIAKLHVKQSLRKDLNVATVVIDRSQVKELQKKRIIVSDTYAKQTNDARQRSRRTMRPQIQPTARTNR